MSIDEALDASKKAWEARKKATEKAQEADSAVIEALVGKLVFVSGSISYEYVPLGKNRESRGFWTHELVTIEAVDFDGAKHPFEGNRMLVTKIDGSKWLMPVVTARIELAPPETPTDGSYLCKACDKTVKHDETHTHNCPVEGEECGSRSCNVSGSCQA